MRPLRFSGGERIFLDRGFNEPRYLRITTQAHLIVREFSGGIKTAIGGGCEK